MLHRAEPDLRPILWGRTEPGALLGLGLVLAGFLLVNACSSDGLGGSGSGAGAQGSAAVDPHSLLLDTDPGGNEPQAGIVFSFNCRTFKPISLGDTIAEGAEVPLPAVATVTVSGPVGPLAVDGTQVRFAKVGTYQIACALPTLGLIDPTPASVQVGPGNPTQIDTTLVDPQANPVSSVKAGTTVSVQCSASDAYGNGIVQGFSAAIAPDPGQAPSGLLWKTSKSGQFQVACQVDGVADPTPAPLQVVANVPRHLFTLIDPQQIEAGHASSLTCVANDEFLNPIADFPFSLDLDPALTVKGTFVSATLAGLRKVQCVPQDGPWDLYILHPATLAVVPAEPAQVVLTRVPEKDVYKDNEKVQFLHAVTDAFGNLRAGDTVALSVTKPTTGYSAIDNETLQFLSDATYFVQATVVDFPAIQTQMPVVVDGTPPLLSIDYPPWGSTLTEKPSVAIKGTAGDPGSGVKSLLVTKTSYFVDPAQQSAFVQAAPCLTDADCKGQGLCVGEDPAFLRCSVAPWSAQHGAVHGLNAVRADAIDSGGSTAKATRGFYYASKYYPADAAAPQANLVPDGMQVFLGKDFLDDGVHDPAHPDDLATLMELVLKGMNLNSLLPVNAGSGDLAIALSNTTIGQPHVALQPVTGGLHMVIKLSDFYTDIDVKAKTKLGPITVSVHVTGHLTMDAIVVDTTLLVSVVAGVPDVQIQSNSVDLQNLQVHIDGIAGLLDPLVNLILSSYKAQLQAQMQSALAQALPGVLSKVLQSFAINQALPLPGLLPGQQGVTIQFASILKDMQFSPQGGLLHLDAGFVAPAASKHKVLGSLGRGGCMGKGDDAFAIDQNQRLQIALHDDVLNQALYAIWHGGALQIPSISAAQLGLAGGNSPMAGLSLDGATFALDLFLPPILETCNTASPQQIRLQAGDVQATANLNFAGDPLQLGLFLSADVTATLDLATTATGTALQLTLGKPQLLMELYTISAQFADAKAAFATLLETQVQKALGNGIPGLGSLALALPALDLGGLVPGLANGAKLSFVIKDLQRSGGYTAVSAALQ